MRTNTSSDCLPAPPGSKPLCTAFGQSMGACYVMWESLSNQLACLHEINSGREKRISSPDTIRLVVDSQACIGLHVRVRPPQVVRFNQTRADLMNGNRMKANEMLYLISV